MEKNIYAQNLNLNFELDLTSLHKIQKAITDHSTQQIFETASEDIDKNLVAFLHTLNIIVPHYEIFYTPPGQCQAGLHIDGHEIGHNYAKLNWVFGSKESFMKWFQPKLNIEAVFFKTSIGTDYLGYSRSDCSLVWSHKIAQPTLVNVGVAHCIDNLDNKGRWCVSHCLADIKYSHRKSNQSFKMLEWDEVLERLQPWVTL